MRASVRVGCVLVASASAVAGVEGPRRIDDLRTVVSPFDGSKPHGLTSIGGIALFAAQPDDGADRLYASNGTAPGTVEVARPCPPHEGGTAWLYETIGDRAYYAVLCNESWSTLWSTDGTAAGTAPILPSGQFHWPGAIFSVPQAVAEGDEMIFLQGGNYDVPPALWRTDGTAAGTTVVAGLASDFAVTTAIARRGANDYLLLVWEHFERLSIWRSDGTTQGTIETVDFPVGEYWDYVRAFAATPSGFAFVVQRGESYRTELWHSDGTPGGTILLASFDEMSAESLVVRDGSIYLAGRVAGASGIFRSEGSPQETRLIAYLDPFEALPWQLEVAGGWIYFFTSDGSWLEGRLHRVAVDGGPLETVAESCDGGYCSEQNPLLWFAAVGDRLVYTRKQDDRLSVWTSAGDGSNALRIAELCAGADCFAQSVTAARSADGLLFPTTSVGGWQRELWFTDGTLAGSARVAGPLSAIPWSSPGTGAYRPIAETGAGWLFAAADDAHGLEPWHAPRAGDSSALIRDLRLDRPSIELVEPIGFAGGSFLFSLWETDGRRTLYRFEIGGDGVEPFLTVPILGGQHGGHNGQPQLREAGNAWFFFDGPLDAGGDSSAVQVWRYDPESGDLRALFEEPSGTGIGALAPELLEQGGNAFLLGSRNDALHPAIYRIRPLSGAMSKELDLPASFARSAGRFGDRWFLIEDEARLVAFDLAARRRVPLADFGASYIAFARAFSHGGLFAVEGYAPDGDARTTLWQSDGTPDGTAVLASWEPGPGCSASLFVPPPAGSSWGLFTVTSSCDGSIELWVTDGSRERTRMLRRFSSGEPRLANGGLLFRGEIFFLVSTYDGSAGCVWQSELWRTDGTPAGTGVVVELPASYYGPPGALEGAVGGEAFRFAWSDELHGGELWRSDGTEEGTRLESDLEPGPASSWPRDFHRLGDQVLFVAQTSGFGLELWQTDGSLAVPALVADLYPGGESSRPWIVASSESAAILLADDGLVGRELWEIDSPSVAPCAPSDGALCLAGGRFRARAIWRDFEGRSGEAEAVGLTGDSGYFWFFDPDSPELLLKVVDACGLPSFENFWAFSTGLTNLEVGLEIVDSWSGERSRIDSQMGRPFAPRFDSGSFHVCDAVSGGAGVGGGTAPAIAAGDRLPLLGGRFEVTADWRRADGTTGRGQAAQLGDGGGYFWFFGPSNVELFVKMADACDLGGFDNYWLFAAGLTDLEVTLTARDVVSGEQVVYHAEPGRPFAPILDTGRFRVCTE